MAYNNVFPVNYQPYYAQQMQSGYPQQQVPMQTQQMSNQSQSQQIQQSGFVLIPSEEVARNYPVAPGNSVSFKNENAPYVYVKTMGYSPLDVPTFEKFRLVKEDNTPVSDQKTKETVDLSNYTLKSDFEKLKKQFESFKESFEKHEVIEDE